MNTTELKALADQCICHPASRGIEDIEKAGEGIKTLIAALESAQDERRVLLATEQNLREELAALKASIGEPVFWAPSERDGTFHHNHSSETVYRYQVAGWRPLYAIKDNQP